MAGGFGVHREGGRRPGDHAVSVRRHLARWTSRWAFRSARASSRLLLGFCRAERNSELELLAAARLTASAEHRALYLRHALDERRHAELFFRRANGLHAPSAPVFPDVDIDDLFVHLGERDFLAFVHNGETDGAAQFRGYVDALRARADEDSDDMAATLAKLFAGILVDEDRHERTSWTLLVERCGGDEALARRRLRAMRLLEAGRRWHRAGRGLAAGVYVVTMLVLFVACAPLSLWLRRRRPTPTGWA